jgi:coenzyme F420-0:L-glutamate ligase/coenzyme F420-1:gamma-L-glutamate ligase
VHPPPCKPFSRPSHMPTAMSRPGPLRFIPLTTGLVEVGEDLPSRLEAAWRDAGAAPEPGDVIVMASKVMAVWEGRVVDLASVTPSPQAEELAAGSGLPAPFCEIAIRESDRVLGGVPGALLTLARGILIANAGADLSNIAGGHAVLWPRDAWEAARRMRDALAARGFTGLGVVVVDSHVQPLRFGTVGIALGWSGLQGVEDVRGRADLYGKPLHVTRRNVADQLASAGTLVMGESDEATPGVLVKGLGVSVPVGGEQGPQDVLVPPGECLFTPVYLGGLLEGEDD